MKFFTALDENNHYFVKIQIIENEQLAISFSAVKNANSLFIKNLIDSTNCYVNNQLLTLKPIDSPLPKNNHTLKFDIKNIPNPNDIILQFRKNNFLKLMITNGHLKLACLKKFCISETRFISYGLDTGNLDTSSIDNGRFLCKTDLHTHFDGILPASSLMGIALSLNIKIDTPYLISEYLKEKNTAERFEIDDTIEITLLQQQYPPLYQFFYDNLAIPSGQIVTFQELDQIYAFRDLLTNNLALFPYLLEEIAIFYKNQNINYVEISLNNILYREWQEASKTVIRDIEIKYNIKIRFLAAIYNYKPTNENLNDLDKVIDSFDYEYLVGVDFAGHEQYSFRDERLNVLLKTVSKLAQNKSSFIIRIHAGENNLHLNNVHDVLLLAKRYHIRIRIGHGLFGLNDETIRLLSELREYIIVELNPDSNIALNNIQSLADFPLKTLEKYNIPFVLGTDGAGIYQTNYQQLRKTLTLCGATENTFKNISKTEENYKTFITANNLRIDYIKKINYISYPIVINNESGENAGNILEKEKKPIYIASDCRDNINNLSINYLQYLIKSLFELLIIIDPKKSFIIINYGLSEVNVAVNIVVNFLNKKYYSQEKIRLYIALPLQKKSRLKNERILIIGQTLTDFPKNMANYISLNQGVSIFIGGDTLTGDIILEMLKTESEFVIGSDSCGSANKFKTSNEKLYLLFELAQYLKKNYPSILFSQANLLNLNEEKIYSNRLILEHLHTYLDQDYRTLHGWKERSNLWGLADDAANPALELIKQFQLTLSYKNNSSTTCISLAKLLHGLSEWFYKKSQYHLALDYLKIAESICENARLSFDKKAVLANIYLSFGRLYTWQDDGKKVCLFYLKKAHSIMSQLYGKNDSETTLRAYGAIGVCLNKFKDYKKAKFIFKNLLNNPHMKKLDWQESGYAHNLSDIYLKQKKYEKYKDYANKSLTIYSHHKHPQRYVFFNTAGFNYLQNENNFDKAKENFSQASKGYDKMGDNLDAYPISVAEAYYGLALCHFKSGNIEESRAFFIKCREIIQLKSIDIRKHPNFSEYALLDAQLSENDDRSGYFLSQ